MRVGAKSVVTWALPLAILAAAAMIVADDPGGIATRISGVEFDAYQHLRPRPYQDTALKTGHAIRILDIDAPSIARFGHWPWSRNVLARLAGELKKAGAAVLVFDLPLDRPDAASPARLAELLPDTAQSASLRTQLAQLPSPDDVFAAALTGTKSVTGFTLGESGRRPVPKAGFAFTGAARTFGSLPDFSLASGSLPRIEAASAGIGARNLPADPDGKVRSVPLIFRLDGVPVPSLEAEILRLISGDSDIAIHADEPGLPRLDARPVVVGASAGAYDFALRPDGALQVYYAGPRPERLVSAAKLDEGRIAPASLKGAIVYVAPPNAMIETPDGPRSRAELRAEALENMLLGAELKPGSTPEASLAFLIIVGAGLVYLFARVGVLSAGVLAAAAILGIQSLAWFLFANTQILLDAANPSVALAVAFIAGFSARRLEVSRARNGLKSSFADSLPARAIQAIAAKPSLLRLDGETRNVTSLSCGLRRFAAIAESFADDPAGFTRLINAAIAPLIEDAIHHGGMIARFDGEGFTACWNAPLDDSEHTIHACEAANRMTVTLAEVNEQLARERRLDGTSFQPIEIGIGISTGRAIAGGFTAHGRTIYSVTGDSTVMADRIRALSAQYGPAVIVSEDARKAAQRGFAFLEVDFIVAGPRDEPTKLYAMLGNPLVRASPKFRALETFHEHIFQSLRLQQWEKARGLIDQCRKLSGASQKIYDLHLARIDYFEGNPPGADWDGAFRPILE
ncbi:MAG: CHASE2 domain-containing protein [Rhizomicrobium sp.]